MSSLSLSLGLYLGSGSRHLAGASEPAEATARLTIESGTVSSDLTSFPVFVRLSDAPASFWSAAALRSDGGNIRVRTTGEDLVPMDLVWFDKAGQDGLIVFLAGSVLAASDNEWDIWVEEASVTGLAVDDANGRNAVWAGYEHVTFDGAVNRTGGASLALTDGAQPETVAPGEPMLFTTGVASPDVNAHQGIATDGSHYYAFDSNAIRKYDLNWSLVTQNTDPQGDADVASNLTDGFVLDGTIYAALGGVLASWDASDLSFIAKVSVNGPGGHGAGQCWNPDIERVVAVDWPSATVLNLFGLDGVSTGSITLSATIAEAQGLTYMDGFYWINSDSGDRTLKVTADGTIVSQRVAQPGTGSYEGIDHTDDGKLLVLVDPGAIETVYTLERVSPRLFPGGALSWAANGLLSVVLSGVGTAWTLAASYRPTDDVQRAVAGVGGFAKIVIDDGDSLGVWDENQAWQYCSPTVDPSKDAFHRAHATYSGTAARTIRNNAASKGTDADITAEEPTSLFLGAGGASVGTEDWRGDLGFIYLRAEVLSDDWIAAEYAMLSNPAGFYAVADPPEPDPPPVESGPRITEAGDTRITESNDTRITE